jgi:hypothetical protein
LEELWKERVQHHNLKEAVRAYFLFSASLNHFASRNTLKMQHPKTIIKFYQKILHYGKDFELGISLRHLLNGLTKKLRCDFIQKISIFASKKKV